ncbi:MAG: DUF167 domain-containing protein [Thermoanaerobaculum sp.]
MQLHAGGCFLRVKVVPGGKKLAVVGVIGDSLKVSLTAAAERGEANRQLQGFLAEVLGISPSSVVLKAGLTSKNKLVFLAGVEPERVLQRLQGVLSFTQ